MPLSKKTLSSEVLKLINRDKDLSSPRINLHLKFILEQELIYCIKSCPGEFITEDALSNFDNDIELYIENLKKVTRTIIELRKRYLLK